MTTKVFGILTEGVRGSL